MLNQTSKNTLNSGSDSLNMSYAQSSNGQIDSRLITNQFQNESTRLTGLNDHLHQSNLLAASNDISHMKVAVFGGAG